MIGRNKIYFDEIIINSENGKKKGEAINNIILNIDGTQLIFRADNSSKMADKTMVFIVNGLNHLLFWAQDKEKEIFINKFCEYMYNMRTTLISNEFQREVEYRIMNGSAIDAAQARADILFRVISNIPDIIIDTIIEYVDENTINNIVTDFHQASLDAIDVLTLNTTITLAKIVTIGFTMLPKMRIDFYTYEPIMKCIDMIGDRLALSYFINIKPSMENYNILVNKNIKDSLYEFLYVTINGTEEMEENQMTVLFKNHGLSRSTVNETIFRSLIGSVLFKYVPIDVENDSVTKFDFKKDDYKKFKFVSKNTIKFLKTISHNMSGHKHMIKHKHIVNTHSMENVDSTDDYESSMKQELYMEKKNVSDIKRRRYYIELLKLYSDDYFDRHNLKLLTSINRNSLGNHFVNILLSQIGEDHLSLKLLDINTYSKLLYIISNKLHEKYPLISLAIKADTKVESNIYLKADIQKRIKDLLVYKRYPNFTNKNLERIIGYSYKFDRGDNEGSLIDISDEFIKYLEDRENNEFNIEFIDNYIYYYEKYI